MSSSLYPSVAAVDLAAYAANIALARKHAGPKVALVAVVKANGYGLGALPLAQRAMEAGAAMVGVAVPGEGLALREAGFPAPILLLMQPGRSAFPDAVHSGLEITLCDHGGAEALDTEAGRQGIVAPVHCMVDTGMGRQGFALETAAREIGAVAALPHLRLAGVATHYPIADCGADPFTRTQIDRLRNVVDATRAAGVDCGAIHGANSAGIINFPDPLFTLARAGIMTFGVWPTDTPPVVNPLRPVLRWTTYISQLRELPPGHTVSYARTYTAREGMRAAVLPIGYADGFRLAFSNRAEVLIRGQRCPVRGRVCMDQTVVDVSHVPEAAPGDEVVLAGVQGEDEITLDELAAHAETIPYEILTGIGPRVVRTYSN